MKTEASLPKEKIHRTVHPLTKTFKISVESK